MVACVYRRRLRRDATGLSGGFGWLLRVLSASGEARTEADGSGGSIRGNTAAVELIWQLFDSAHKPRRKASMHVTLAALAVVRKHALLQ